MLLVGCVSKPKPPIAPEPQRLAPATETQPAAAKPAEAPPARPETGAMTPAPEPTQPLAKPTEPAPVDRPKEVTVSKEVYQKTFGEIEALIREWNGVIARKDYAKWHAALSRAYITDRGSEAYLAELSRNQKLRERGIVLKNLRDYFENVVVPARVDAGLDRIEFASETKVKAYANIGGDLAILFYVVREDGGWKIGTSEE
jgi:hypothetical protein